VAIFPLEIVVEFILHLRKRNFERLALPGSNLGKLDKRVTFASEELVVRRLRRMALHSAVAVCFVSLPLSIVRASTISGGTASFTETLPFSTALAGFNQYNGALPLASIEFLFVTDLTGTATVRSGPGNPTQDVAVDFSGRLDVSNPSDTAFLVTASPIATAPITVTGDGTANHFNVSGTSLTARAVLTDPALFAPFVGTGTFNLPLRGNLTIGFTPNLIVPFSVEGTGSVDGTLEVLYTPISEVAEPSAVRVVLLGGLFLGCYLGLLRRRGRYSLPSTN